MSVLLRRLTQFIQPPVFDDEDLTLRAQLLNVLILAALVSLPLVVIGNFVDPDPQPFVFLISLIGTAGAFGMRWMMVRRRVYQASVVWVVLSLGLVTASIIALGTVRATNTFIFLIIIAMAGFLLNQRAVIWVTVYSCGIVLVLGWAQNVGWLASDLKMPPMSAGVGFNLLALFIGMAMFTSVSVQVMNRIIAKARKELAERRDTEQTLRQRDAIMEAATFAARRFLQVPDWRDEINGVLARLGIATNSSHVFIFENHVLEDGKKVTSQRYEWAASGMKPDIDNPLYQNAPLITPATEKWYNLMSSGEAFFGTRDILAPSEQQKYINEGLLSFINVPIFVGERWWGLIGFDDYVTKREWKAVEIEAVKITASTLGAAIQRQLNDLSLRRRDAILQAVNFAAQQFFQTEDWRKSIQAVLEHLGKATESSHAYIFEKHSSPDRIPLMSQRYEWVADGVKPDMHDPAFQNIQIFHSNFEPWYDALAHGEVQYGNLETLHKDDAEFFGNRRIKAIIDAPIMVANQWWGVLGFDDCFVMRDWGRAEIDAIRIAAATLGAAIQRQESDDALRISELRHRAELEHYVQERTRQLEAALKEIESVSYTASHDLRTPVRAINGYTNILLREFPDVLSGEVRDYLEKIDRESQRMGNLLDDLIRLIQLNRQLLHITRINLSELADLSVKSLKQQFPDQPVEVDLQHNLFVNGDQNMLQIVMDELLDNAWKFTAKKSNPCIEIGEMEQEGQRVFYIRDNGIGFEMAYAHRLFRNFEQLHLPGIYAGTGMGLAIIQRIIQRHGGKVWLEGVPDEGTTVYFTLPG